jgi:small multidrug resistance pump
MLLTSITKFYKIIPTVCLTIFYLVSFYLMTFVMDKLPIAIVYATWSGLGILQ